MKLREALDTMGFEDLPTQSELEREMRRLRVARHPDSGGSDLEFVSLTQAGEVIQEELQRESALSTVDHNTSLAIANAVVGLVEAQAGRDERASKRAENIQREKQLIAHRTNPFRHKQWAAAVLGALSAIFSSLIWGGVGVIPALFEALFSTATDDARIALQFAAGICFFGAALLFWIRTYRSYSVVAHITDVIEDIGRNLSQSSYFFKVLRWIGIGGVPFTVEELEHALSELTSDTPYRARPLFPIGIIPNLLDTRSSNGTLNDALAVIGIEEFSSLLISKGLELGHLEEKIQQVQGEIGVAYSVRAPRADSVVPSSEE